MKLVTILSLGIALIACTFADAGWFAERRAERQSRRLDQGCQGCGGTTQGTTVSGCQTCGGGVTYSLPSGVATVGKPTFANANCAPCVAAVEKKLLAFAASNQCPANAKAVIDCHFGLKTLTKGAINWLQLLKDIEAAAPEVVTLVQQILADLQ